MIQHIVLCRFRSDVDQAEIEAIWAALDGLRNIVPGLVDASFGANQSPEGLANGYTHGFVITFADKAARDAYLDHADDIAAGARLVDALDGRLDGICVLDI